MIYTTRLSRIGPAGSGPTLTEHMLGTCWDDDGARNAGYSPKIELTQADFTGMDQAVAAIERCSTGFTYEVLERNYADLVSIHRFVTLSLGLGRKFGTPDRMTYARSVMSATVNWLTAMHLFLDHTLTDLSRRYGDTSQQLERLKLATHKGYDDRPGYRFAYRLRRYVLHCGLPASSLDGEVVDSKMHVRLLLSRDELLDSFTWGPHVTADLKAADPHFELEPLAEEAMAGLRDVHHELMLIQLEDAADRSPALVEALARLDAAGLEDIPSLYLVHEQTPEAIEYSVRRFSRDQVDQLSQVRAGTKTAKALIRRPTTPPPVLAPDSVAEHTHREARAVRVMSAWYSNSPDRIDKVNNTMAEIVEADGGDVEPLITGLINLCGVLAAVAAIGTNRNAEGLIAALVGRYANTGQDGTGST